MIIRHSILDLWELSEFIEPLNEAVTNTQQALRDVLTDKYSYVLSLKDKPMVVIIERRSRYTANLHVYFAKECRGKEAVSFINEVHEYIKKTDLRFIFNYTNERKVKFFMNYFKSTRYVGEYKDHSVYKTGI